MPKAGVGLEHTGVDGEPLALHEAIAIAVQITRSKMWRRTSLP
jgi:hypothetical protein